MAFGETVECLARNEVQGDLSFELDAMDAVPGHGFHPLKARQRRSILNLQTVHSQGRIPYRRQIWTPLSDESGRWRARVVWTASLFSRRAMAFGGLTPLPCAQFLVPLRYDRQLVSWVLVNRDP